MDERAIALLLRIVNSSNIDQKIIKRYLDKEITIDEAVSGLRWEEWDKEVYRQLFTADYVKRGFLLTDKGQKFANVCKDRYEKLKEGMPLEERKRLYSSDVYEEPFWVYDGMHGTRSLLITHKVELPDRKSNDVSVTKEKVESRLLALRKCYWKKAVPLIFQVLGPVGAKLIWFLTATEVPNSRHPRKGRSWICVQSKYFDYIRMLAGEKEINWSVNDAQKKITDVSVRASVDGRDFAYLAPMHENDFRDYPKGVKA